MNARSVVLAMGCAVFAVGARAQAVDLIKDSPLSATWTKTIEQDGRVRVETIEAARSSDGSVYERTSADGRLLSILIYDVPKERIVSIEDATKQTFPARPGGHFVVRTVAEQRAVLEHSQRPTLKKMSEETQSTTPLGTKVVNGMTLFGHSSITTRDDGLTAKDEVWSSDTGLVVLSIHSNSKSNATWKNQVKSQKSTAQLVKLELAEPDASLFLVPKGYAKEFGSGPPQPFGATLNNTCTGAPEPWGGPPTQDSPPGFGARGLDRCPLPPPRP